MFEIEQLPVTLRPKEGSRRPEYASWAFGVILFVVLTVVQPEAPALRFGAWALGLYFGLSGAVMTLGNWLERNTRLTLAKSGVKLEQPVRSVEFRWDEVERVELQKGAHGERVFVHGADRHFSFRSATVVSIRGKIRDHYGFEESRKIVKTLVSLAGIQDTPQELANLTAYTRQ